MMDLFLDFGWELAIGVEIDRLILFHVFSLHSFRIIGSLKLNWRFELGWV